MQKLVENLALKYYDKVVDLRLYECKYIKGAFKLHDHFEYKFVDKNEILEYDLCPADIPLAEYIKNVL